MSEAPMSYSATQYYGAYNSAAADGRNAMAAEWSPASMMTCVEEATYRHNPYAVPMTTMTTVTMSLDQQQQQQQREEQQYRLHGSSGAVQCVGAAEAYHNAWHQQEPTYAHQHRGEEELEGDTSVFFPAIPHPAPLDPSRCAGCQLKPVSSPGSTCMSRRCAWFVRGLCPQCGRTPSSVGRSEYNHRAVIFCSHTCASESRHANWCPGCAVRQIQHGSKACGAAGCEAEIAARQARHHTQRSAAWLQQQLQQQQIDHAAGGTFVMQTPQMPSPQQPSEEDTLLLRRGSGSSDASSAAFVASTSTAAPPQWGATTMAAAHGMSSTSVTSASGSASSAVATSPGAAFLIGASSEAVPPPPPLTAPTPARTLPHQLLPCSDRIAQSALQQQRLESVAGATVRGIVKIACTTEHRKAYAAQRVKLEASLNDTCGIGAPKYGHGGEGNEHRRYVVLRSVCGGVGAAAFPSAGGSTTFQRHCGVVECDACNLLAYGPGSRALGTPAIRTWSHASSALRHAAAVAMPEKEGVRRRSDSTSHSGFTYAVVTCRTVLGNPEVRKASDLHQQQESDADEDAMVTTWTNAMADHMRHLPEGQHAAVLQLSQQPVPSDAPGPHKKNTADVALVPASDVHGGRMPRVDPMFMTFVQVSGRAE